MHIVSYRGPGMAGGVSAALERAWESNNGSGQKWWHVTDEVLSVTTQLGHPASEQAVIPHEVIEGHYRFCNEFLWPVMHDLPQYCRYSSLDRDYYDAFNNCIGWCITRKSDTSRTKDYFIQDYQLALLPAFLSGNAGFCTIIFWHIPWPKAVLPQHVPDIQDVARGLLKAKVIGFHTDEYAENFLNFVAKYLPQYSVNTESQLIWSNEPALVATPGRRIYSGATKYRALNATSRSATRVVVAPLGIDYEHWRHLATQPATNDLHPLLAKTPFILSVDRADYTKGVTDRLKAIDLLLTYHPELIGRITFAQICGRTRSGLATFDHYWNECQYLYQKLEMKYGSDSWQPLVWLEASYPSAELAKVYRQADMMLVNAVRDGLNLTAKEFVACQDMQQGVLALSSGTGASEEIGSHALSLDPGNSEQIAHAIFRGITMSPHERAWRMANLKQKVKSNSLSSWWYKFTKLLLNEDVLPEIAVK